MDDNTLNNGVVESSVSEAGNILDTNASESNSGTTGHNDNLGGIQCRCGCVPVNMMSMFQMAALRAKHREEKAKKALERVDDDRR